MATSNAPTLHAEGGIFQVFLTEPPTLLNGTSKMPISRGLPRMRMAEMAIPKPTTKVTFRAMALLINNSNR